MTANRRFRHLTNMQKIYVYALLIATALLQACSPKISTNQSETQSATNAVNLEQLYKERFEAYSAGNLAGLNLYSPLKVVNGAPNYKPFDVSPSPLISETAIDKAVEFVSPRNSTALLIWKDGKLVERQYFGDHLQGGTINSRSLACLLYTSPSPRDATLSRMPSSA